MSALPSEADIANSERVRISIRRMCRFSNPRCVALFKSETCFAFVGRKSEACFRFWPARFYWDF